MRAEDPLLSLQGSEAERKMGPRPEARVTFRIHPGLALNPHLCCLPAVWVWPSDLNSLCLHFIIHKRADNNLPSLVGWCGSSVRW